MTDPIVQDQNQNGQNPQTPVQTNEPQIDFDLNLPKNEEIPANEEPTISLDFDDIQKTNLDTPKETNVNDEIPVVEETSPVAEETTPVAEEITPVVEENTPVVEENTPVVEEDTPVAEETTPVANENVIASNNEAIQLDTPKETKVNDETPVAEEAAPVAEEAAPIAEEAAPVTEETTPVTEEITPVVEEATQNIESNPINEIATEFTAPQKTEETLQQPESKEDNRLDQEDALVEQEKKPIQENKPTIETKNEPEVKSESLNIFEETPQEDLITDDSETVQIKQETEPAATEPISKEIPTTETAEKKTLIENTDKPTLIENTEEKTLIENNEQEKPTPGQPEQNFPPSANLNQDQEIIAKIQASVGKPVESAPVIPTTPTSTEVNLDDLLNSPTPTSQETNPSNLSSQPNQSNLSNAQTIPAFNWIHWYSLPPIATQISEQIKKPWNKKILINFGIGILVFVVGWFMFKTMYPLEYQKMMWNWPQPTTIENQLTDNDIIQTEEETWSTTDSDLFNNPSLANYHSAAQENTWFEEDLDNEDDFNAFEDIEQSLTETDNETLQQIQNYIDVWRQYTVIGKKNNDEEIMKYSLFLYKKASTLLTDIENGKQISTDELDKQLVDLETYLQKLTGKNSDGEIVLQQAEQPTPEEFFWSENSWETTEQPEAPTTEIPTATQETENETENLSGDENTITQTNELNR